MIFAWRGKNSVTVFWILKGLTDVELQHQHVLSYTLNKLVPGFEHLKYGDLNVLLLWTDDRLDQPPVSLHLTK